MAPVFRTGLLFAALCLVGGASFGALGSRITLRLEGVTLAETTAAVARVSGVTVDAGPALSAPRLPGPGTRASFAWENASLDRVLREVCARFQCGCGGGSDGYTLFPAGPSSKSPLTFEKAGVRVALSGIAVTESRSKLFARAARPGEPRAPSLVLSLLVDLDELHEDWEARVEKVGARDNLGNELGDQVFDGSLWRTFPGQRTGTVRLPLANLQARRLVWLEGDLVLSRRSSGARIELPYPAPGAVVQSRVHPGLSLSVSHSRPAAPSPAAEYPEAPAGPLSHPVFEAEQGPSLLMRAYQPMDPANPEASESFPVPRAVGRSGKSYRGRSSAGGAMTRDGWTLYYTGAYFPGAAEPLEKLVWELRGEKSRELRIRFRLSDIPIPAADALPVQQQWLSSDRELPASPPRPLHRRGAASLRSPVRLNGVPAPGGVLRIGLSTRSGMEWSAARWCQAAVDTSGAAVLEGVAPGRYRVLRQYLASGAPSFAAEQGKPPAAPAGRWLNGETEVAVPEAGVVDLAPLELTADPPPAAAPAAAPQVAGVFDRDGIRMEPASIRLQNGRAIQWEGRSLLSFYERGDVSLSCRLKAAGAAAEGVLFTQNVAAADDLGTILTADDSVPWYGGPGGEAGTSFHLSAAHPKATKLAWVEGELLAYRRRRHVRIEAPFPPPGRNVLAREGANLLATAADEAPPSAPAPAAKPAAPDLLPPDGLPGPAEPRVRFRLCYRDCVLQLSPAGEDLMAPIAIGKSGAEYRPRGGGGTSTSVQGWTLHARRASYPDAREPLEKLVWEFDVWDTPEPIAFFRLRDVPLPPRIAPPGQEVGVRQAPAPHRQGEAPRPQTGKAWLVVRVLRDERAVPDGTIQFGVAARTGASWGPMRWVEVPVDEAGRARLAGLRPGRYRVALRYAAEAGATPIGRAPAEVTLAAGRELQLPPFRLPAVRRRK